jgi:hypothetical protein
MAPAVPRDIIRSISPGAYGFDQQSNLSQSSPRGAGKVSVGVSFARKMVYDIKNKPCVTYATERRKNLRPACATRFKLLGFSQRGNVPDRVDYGDQRSILLSSPTNNNVNLRLRSPEERSRGVI